MKLAFFIPVLLALAAPDAPALAADGPEEASGIPAPFKEVEPGIGDDPAAVGLRQLSVDLQQPNSFQNVYAVPGSDGEFMRIEGGLYAVFPRSEYVGSRFSTHAIIPSGTIFHIGAPPPETAVRADPLSPRASRMDTRLIRALHRKIESNETSEPHRATQSIPIATARANDDRPDDLPVTGQSTILNDMDYRHRRLAELMTRAVTTGRRRAGARRDVKQPAGTVPAAASRTDDQAARGRSSSPSSK